MGTATAPKMLRQHARTQGEIEAKVSAEISRFQIEYMGRGPKEIRTHLIGDLLVVRLRGVLATTEQHLVKSLPLDCGRRLLKDVRTQLIKSARSDLEAMLHDILGVAVISLHHDISTITGEEVIVFTLVDTPRVREKKQSEFR